MSPKTLRITSLGLLLGLAAFAATPFIIGRNIEQVAIANVAALIPPEIQSQIEIRERGYNSGWFSSDAFLEMEYLPLGGQPLIMQLNAQIQHGPLLFTPQGIVFGLVYADIDPQFDSTEIQEALQNLPFDLPDIRMDLQVKLNGDLYARMHIAPVSHSDANGLLEFAGTEANLTAYTDGSAELELLVGALTAREFASNFEITMEGLTARASSDQISDIVARSAAHVSMPLLRSSSPFAVELLDLELESRVQPSLYGSEYTDWYQRTQVGRIQSELPLSTFSWTSEINETRSDLFRRYYQLLADMQREMNASGGIFTEAVTQSAEEFATLLLQNRIVLNNTLAANAYDGDHSLELRIQWLGLPELTDIGELDVNAMLGAVDLTFDMTLDLDAILRSPLAALVDTYVQQGYLQLDSGRVLMRVEIRDSELSINGQPKALDELL